MWLRRSLPRHLPAVCGQQRSAGVSLVARRFWFGSNNSDGSDGKKGANESADAAKESTEAVPASAVANVGTGDNSPRINNVIGISTVRRPLFPAALQPLHLTDTRTVEALLQAQTDGHNYVALFLKKPEFATPEGDAPELFSSVDEVYNIGTFAQIQSIAASPDGESHQVFLMGHRRVDLKRMLEAGPPPRVEVDHWPRLDYDSNDMDIRAYRNQIVSTFREVVRINPLFRESLQQISVFTQRIDMHDPFKLADFAASLTTANGEELQKVLEERDAAARLRLALDLLMRERELSRIQDEISREVEQRIAEGQRKYFLMEQHKQIKKELGLERDDKDILVQNFRERLRELTEDKGGQVPEEAMNVINEEISKFEGLEKGSAEFNLTRNYLDWLTAMPYGLYSSDSFDVTAAQDILDRDHYGLEDVKRRIREFIAVGKLRGSVQGKILCFVGPPGVGKTSIGKSIAAALGREFYRFSVGGLSDVAAIKGHRRTYVGAMPGQLIQCLKKTSVANPVVMIDEVDKLGRGYQGDPASALLELLDPAQNNSFADHYLDVPFDLSKVLFICTANTLDTIPGPLLDRMEVIRVSGYDLPEKVEISKRYLIPKSLAEAGLKPGAEVASSEGATATGAADATATGAGKPDHSKESVSEQAQQEAIDIPEVSIADEAIEELIRRYCREAGVRNLEKQIEKISRKLALKVVESISDEKGEPVAHEVTVENLPDYVGKPIFISDRLYEGDVLPPGVVMGLAWTAMGGSSLYIETSAVRKAAASVKDKEGDAAKDGPAGPSPGSGRFMATGQLGSVMEESSKIAISVARKILQTSPPGYGGEGEVDPLVANFFDQTDIHMHVPEGATPKDGPSAGVTMITALLSLATGVPCRANVAMTGEVSLTGKVLPVGGIKEKTIAARRAGVDTLVFPAGNKADFEELQDYLKEGITVKFASTYADVQAVAFDGMVKAK